MLARRNFTAFNGIRPGSRDNPHHDPKGRKYLEAEAQVRQDVVDKEARKRNPAYGNLNLSDWSERYAAGNHLSPIAGRRPRPRKHDITSEDL